MSQEKNTVTFRKNPNIDFLFGYFGNLPVPTKQIDFKPVDFIETNENGEEKIIKDFYMRKPDKASVKNFEAYIQTIARDSIPEASIIKMPDNVQVCLSFSITEKRFFEVDVDNLTKTVLDSLKGIAYDDDSQVTSLIVDKHVHPMKLNGILIAITKITDGRKGMSNDGLFAMV